MKIRFFDILHSKNCQNYTDCPNWLKICTIVVDFIAKFLVPGFVGLRYPESVQIGFLKISPRQWIQNVQKWQKTVHMMVKSNRDCFYSIFRHQKHGNGHLLRCFSKKSIFLFFKCRNLTKKQKNKKSIFSKNIIIGVHSYVFDDEKSNKSDPDWI